MGTVPVSVNRLSKKLTYLSLSANNFTGNIPASISDITSLQFLLLDSNLFNGTFPAEFGNLINLKQLWLSYNPFKPSKIPEEFGNMLSLTYLWMSYTNIYGEIPDSFSKLSNLVHLDLTSNSLYGEIPAGIWMLPNLELLYLYHNQLSGEINKSIGAKNLIEIDVSMNKITGSIPVGFGHLKNLTVLFLYMNQLTGEVPDEIGLLPFLVDLRIFNNNLVGKLPPELGKHSKLGNLEVSFNSLSGEIPEFLCAQGNFSSLVLSNNEFTGSLPSFIGNCPTLNNIMVENNKFSGEIPVTLWSTALNLTTVYMHHNSFTGVLPASLPWNLTRLEVQFNRFSGSIPSSAQNLNVFKASNNLFSGYIPENLAKLSSLQVLDISSNDISGEISNSISSLKYLTEFNASMNRLSGEVPETIGSLPVLTILDLSKNQLHGSIPNSMSNLKLNVLNLSFNDLTGEIPISLQNQVYDESFLSNPKLCASSPFFKLHSCNSKALSSHNLSTGLLVAFIILGVFFFICTSILGLFMLKEYRKRKNDLNTWKTTSFHIGEFNETNIVKQLSNENLIGSGGSGLIYKVSLRNRTEDTLAVKKIWNSRKLDSNLEKEFEAEVQILGSIRHANIVKLYCCISSSTSKLLVYEYMENKSLDRWLHSRNSTRSALDWQTRLSIAIGAAKGLCYMHHDCSPPIVHRDVKSSNILLDSEFNAKIADFGLARMLVNAGDPQSVSAVAGSFGYMAPECGLLRKVNEKVDVYSFGVVLLELTTGREANYGDENSCLSDWAWRKILEHASIEEVVDVEIRDPLWVEDIEVVFRLGVICTNASPTSRPTMKEVCQVLQRCDRSKENGVKGKERVRERDGAPLIGDKWGSGRSDDDCYA